MSANSDISGGRSGLLNATAAEVVEGAAEVVEEVKEAMEEALDKAIEGAVDAVEAVA